MTPPPPPQRGTDVSRRTVLAGSFGVAVLAALAACGKSDTPLGSGDGGTPSTVRWAQIGEGKAEPATVLRYDLGGINLSERLGGAKIDWKSGFTASLPVMEAFQSGDIDFSFATSTAVIYAVGANVPIVPLVAYPLPANEVDLLVHPDSGITTAADLVGKTIADQQGTTSTYSLYRYLEDAGLSFDDIEYSNLSVTDAAAAFTSGQVDAWISWQPQAELTRRRTNATALPGVETFDYAFFVASRDFVDSYPDAAIELALAVRDAQRWLEAEPDTAVGEFANLGGFGGDELQHQVYLDLVKASRLSYSGAGQLGTVTSDIADGVQEAADRFVDLGIYPSKVEVKDWLLGDDFSEISDRVASALKEKP